MKEKEVNGFTIIELLATVTVLSILTVIVIVSVKGVIENGHKSYYDGEEKMITLSGQTYFSDYKSKLPKEIGGIEKVTLKTLIDEKYIDPVYNHNKEACFYDQSFTYAQKIDDENYQYYTYLSCPGGYNTDVDKSKPAIKFSPNKGLSNKNIEVKMEITDNKNIKSYQYIVLKNDVEVKNSNIVPYKGTPTITLTEDGIYQIIGYAWDDATNMGTKTSGKYEIKKTGPNCSNIIFTSDKTPEKWFMGQVNLQIQVPEDTKRWTWATRNALNLTSSTTYGKAKQYLGTSLQTVSFTKDGQNQGKITLYDKVGNHCTIETARYFLWNSPPTFSDFTITSTVRDYNAITTKLTIPASNPPGLPMQMYISNSGFETGGSWETYAPTKSWNVGGSLDGGTRTVYITIRDSLGNKKNIKKTYKVYQECIYMSRSYYYGSCSEECGGGWQKQTTTYWDSLTGNYCKSDVDYYTCNTQSCASDPIMKAAPNYLYTEGVSYYSPEYRENITSIVVKTNTTIPSTAIFIKNGNGNYWDVSEAGDGSVIAYLENDGSGGYKLTIGGDGKVVAPSSCTSLFHNFFKLKSIDVRNLDTSQVVYMTDMFCNAYELTYLDISSFDTSKVKHMDKMFMGCKKLETIRFGNKFDTSNVTTMVSMFQICFSLTSIDLSKFNTPKLQSAWWMFWGCNSITSLTFPKSFDTSNVDNMSLMFNGMDHLVSLDIRYFNTSKVTNMVEMFAWCKKLTTIKVGSGWTTAKARIDDMFEGCGTTKVTHV